MRGARLPCVPELGDVRWLGLARRRWGLGGGGARWVAPRGWAGGRVDSVQLRAPRWGRIAVLAL